MKAVVEINDLSVLGVVVFEDEEKAFVHAVQIAKENNIDENSKEIVSPSEIRRSLTVNGSYTDGDWSVHIVPAFRG